MVSTILLGIFAGDHGFKMNEVKEIETWQGKKHAVVTLFTDFNPHSLNNLFTIQLPAIYQNGNVPVITWEPKSSSNPNDIFRSINSGQHDQYINDWALRLKQLIGNEKKVFIRFAHEVNLSDYQYSPNNGASKDSPQDFVNAWRKVYTMFQNKGLKAPQVKFIFCPNNSDKGKHKMELMYPGNEFIDWFGVDAYNFGHSEAWSVWLSAKDCTLPMINRLRVFSDSKPLALNEIATTSVAHPGKIVDLKMKGQWIKDMFQFAIDFRIGMISYFNIDKETDWGVFGYKYGTSTYNGKNVYDEYKQSVQRPEFISSVTSGNISPVPINPPKDGKLFISFHGTNLRGYPDGRVDLRPKSQEWEMWTFNYIGDSKFTWRSYFGTYLRANPNGTVDLAEIPKDWETWTKIEVGDRVVWKSFFGTYLSGNQNGTVQLVEKQDTWERWIS